jgi:hypothetical protein
MKLQAISKGISMLHAFAEASEDRGRKLNLRARRQSNELIATNAYQGY